MTDKADRLELFVGPGGSDEGPGTRAEPFRTLARARDRVRAIKSEGALPDGGAAVSLREGEYPLDCSFELTEADSGTETGPIVYRAHPGERVRLTGGREVSGFGPVTDAEILQRLDESARPNVLVADLTAQGIAGVVHECPEGHPIRTEKMMEVFFKRRRMTLARWPNEGFALTGEMEPAETHVVYEGDRPQRWSAEDDVWLHGYWGQNWRDHYQQVLDIDTVSRKMSVRKRRSDPKHQPRRRYVALNVLAELDAPGEWYLDRKAGRLYFWAPEPIETGAVIVSLLADPLVRIDGASHVRLEGLVFECSRGRGVEIRGGQDNLVAGCEFRHLNGEAVAIEGGRANGVRSCDIHDVGAGGIILQAGDRKTLEPGECFADNNHIHDYALLARTYRPAVRVGGVGNRVAHNLIHDAPHGGIQLGGNEHVIEFNEIHHVVTETDDAGAFYMGRDLTHRGNVIRHNYFHHLGGFAGIDWRLTKDQDLSEHPSDTTSDGYHSSHPAELNAVYLDDLIGGNTVFGNVFYRVGRGTRVAGGRDTLVENNIYVECNPAVEITGQGLTWSKDYFDGRSNTLIDRLAAVDYQNPPYSERYPELPGILDDNPGAPKYNRVVRNISVDSLWLRMYWGIRMDDHEVHFEDNMVDEDPHFVDMAGENFQLTDDSPAYKLGFQRIPMELIGLVKDEYRNEQGRLLP